MNAQADLLSVSAAAKVLGLSARTLYRACVAGRLGARVDGKGYVITRAELARYRRERARAIKEQVRARKQGRCGAPIKRTKGDEA